jgi:ectoine hydroxylase-related dioxygenase (phytanoyl-CoA dioxygenase family)
MLDPAFQQRTLDEFYREGFAMIPGVLNADECAQLRDLTDYFIDHATPGSDRVTTLGQTQVLRATQSLHRAFCDMLVREPLLSVAEAVVGRNPGMCGQNVIRSGRDQGISHWHVDDIVEFPLPNDIPRHDPRIRLPVFWFSYQIALSDIDSPDHGPTEVVPRSHYSGRDVPRDTDRPMFDGQGPVPILCKAGDVYLFNHQLWHRGAVNRSDRVRYLMQNQYGRAWGPYRFNSTDALKRLPDEEMKMMGARLIQLLDPHRIGPG